MKTLFASLGIVALFSSPMAAEAAVRIKAGRPITIEIPKLSVSAQVDARGLTSQKTMPAPASRRVVWYQGGVVPGQPGDAIMYGHLTGRSFQPEIFSELHALKPKDKIVIFDANHNRHTFRVTRVVLSSRKYVSFSQLDTGSRFIHLNLYTCAGSWNTRTRTYSHYLIVYSTLESSQKLEVQYGG